MLCRASSTSHGTSIGCFGGYSRQWPGCRNTRILSVPLRSTATTTSSIWSGKSPKSLREAGVAILLLQEFGQIARASVSDFYTRGEWDQRRPLDVIEGMGPQKY